MSKLVLKAGTAAAILALLPTFALAATATGQFGVSATVNKNCTVTTTNALTFAAYTPDNTNPQDSTSTVGVKCTNTTPFEIGLNEGGTSGATTTTRIMTSGSNKLNYQLFSDAGRSSNWGNTTGSTVGDSGKGYSTEIVKTIYGRIPYQPDAVPGSYNDTVTITVTY
ncbi:spore coat U domain-containing protein [Zoogloea sp.]|uniref:Csu type fimbrial protein n=1 Tax=Zoogloea sp. TaxID=49181 RepID=UPI0035B05E43